MVRSEKTPSRLRTAVYILLFIAATFAVVYVAFWRGETPTPRKPELPGAGAPPAAPAPPTEGGRQ